jgi:tetratricopeptide (TPR) repeat protein
LPKKFPKPASTSDTIVAEQARFNWKVIAQIVLGFAVLWVTAFMMVSRVGYWGVGVVAAITLAAVGFGLYVWRLSRKSRAIVDILQGATDELGRKAALEKLESADKNDALASLAKAQLIAKDSPGQAMAILEQVDLRKAPVIVQDDIRANLAFLYLAVGRIQDARQLADDIRLDRQPNAKAKAMYAAVVAESYARTGRAADAKKLLETFDAKDPAFGEVRAILLRAQVYTYLATKNRGLVRSAMTELSNIDPNMMGSFLQKGSSPELTKIAREVLSQVGFAPRVKLKPRYR